MNGPDKKPKGYPNRKLYNYPADLFRACRKLGYPGPQTCMAFEYWIYGRTMREIGRMIGITGAAVRTHLLRWRARGLFEFRRRGGNMVNPGIRRTEDFVLKCRHCHREFQHRTWVGVLGEMKGHRCG